MTEKQILDLLHIVSPFLQASVVVLALIGFSHVTNKRAWFWFTMAATLVFIRRVTGTYGNLFSIDTEVIESLITTAASIMWIMFILIRTERFQRRDCNAGEGTIREH